MQPSQSLESTGLAQVQNLVLEGQTLLISVTRSSLIQNGWEISLLTGDCMATPVARQVHTQWPQALVELLSAFQAHPRRNGDLVSRRFRTGSAASIALLLLSLKDRIRIGRITIGKRSVVAIPDDEPKQATV